MFLGGSREESQHRQLVALTAQLQKYQASPYQSDHRKAWKVLSKIKRIEADLVQLKMPYDLSRR